VHYAPGYRGPIAAYEGITLTLKAWQIVLTMGLLPGQLGKVGKQKTSGSALGPSLRATPS